MRFRASLLVVVSALLLTSLPAVSRSLVWENHRFGPRLPYRAKRRSHPPPPPGSRVKR